MKTINFLAVLALVSTSAVAAEYRCTIGDSGYADDFGQTLTAVLSAKTLKLKLKDSTVGEGNSGYSVIGKLNANYQPRPQNAGSLRFLAEVKTYGGGTGCDNAILYIDKNMAAGKDGRLTIQYDCDSDGTGPIFYSYSCRL